MPTRDVTQPNAKTGDDYRAAAARRQAAWRRKHFLLHASICDIVRQLDAAPQLLDQLGNPELAQTIREAASKIGKEL
jgi:hypothetical protein